ncbi:unnamed protein product [Moneuplotes crassus]|uniref:BZIP domain-containing protein n=1 Tax=Euplotes crassus TaxID=5936 RepID=A0AAD1UJD7_EUPCR|nr:unnamed protein product [Moneuplotes crassus]
MNQSCNVTQNLNQHNDPVKQRCQSKPKTPGERSREFRKRKKNYLTRLETKVKTLEHEISCLTQENTELQETITNMRAKLSTAEKKSSSTQPHKSTINKYSHPLHEYEDFMDNQMKKIMIRDPSEIRYSTMLQMKNQSADYSDNRRNFLKQKFDDILQNIACINTKCFMAGSKNVNRAEFLRRNCTKKRREKYINASGQYLFLERKICEQGSLFCHFLTY